MRGRELAVPFELVSKKTGKFSMEVTRQTAAWQKWERFRERIRQTSVRAACLGF